MSFLYLAKRIKREVKKIIIPPHPHASVDQTQFYTIEPNSITRDFNIRLDHPLPNKKYIHIGKNSLISGQYVFESTEGEITIGDNTFIGGSTFICRTHIHIGNNVNISWGGTIYDHDSHSQDYLIRRKDLPDCLKNIKEGQNPTLTKDWSVVKTAPITIMDDAWIGMNCIILKGVTIGEGAIIGAGSVVTSDIPAWTLAAGNPARVIREIYRTVDLP